MKYHENPSSKKPSFSMRKEGQINVEANSRFSQFCKDA